jgi:hypothetical protein
MASSQALREFQDSLEMVEALIKLEQQYKNPPRREEQKIVEALRGGTVVLMVASFEYFLRQLFSERLSILSTQPSPVKFHLLPDKMQVCSVFNTLDYAMKGTPFVSPPSLKKDRLVNIDAACRAVVAKTINPSAFTDSASNPGPATVKEMFSNVGLSDILTQIKPQFDSKWRKPTAHTFVRDTLQGLINCRHTVAHTATVLNVSRSDIKVYKKFITILASILDTALEKQIRHLLTTCI